MKFNTELLCKIVSSISAKKFKLTLTYIEAAKISKVSPEKVYEAILQTYLFNGFPAAINGLNLFSKIYNYDTKKNCEEFDLQEFMYRGEINIRKVYAGRTDILIEKFYSLSPDLKDWMILEGYGKVKGRKGLTLKERELLNVSMLSTNFYKDQLLAHIRGAFNTGNSYDDVEKAIQSTSESNTRSNVVRAIDLLKTQREQK